jgi:zinc protease
MLYELICNASFDESAIEKVRQNIQSEITDYWDSPADFVKQLVREHVYQGSVYAQHPLGTIESTDRITREDLLAYYKQRIVPGHMRIAIVGVNIHTAKVAITKQFQQWQASACVLLTPPEIVIPPVKTVIHPIVRDQVVLAFAGLSVAYHHSYYDALLLFDQIFTGGLQRSMSSRLFQLREQTGLFYSIGGSLVYGSAEQPGLFFIQTMVSQDRLAEAQQAITDVMHHAAETITDDEITIAKNAIMHNIVDQYETQKGIAENVLFIDRMHLPVDYVQSRVQTIKNIDRDAIIKAVSSVMHAGNISNFKVGRF